MTPEPTQPEEPKKPESDDGEQLAEEIAELREKHADAESGTGHAGDPQAGGSGPGTTGHKS